MEGVCRQIENSMSKSSDPWDIYVTKKPMDACERIQEEAKNITQPLRVYACGGDGTLNEVVNGAAGHPDISVAHYPTGTGNDFIRMFGAHDYTLFKSLDRLIDGTPLPVDLIKCNDRYCINICSVGVDANIGRDVHKFSRLPLVSGKGGYILSLISNFTKGINMRLKLRYKNSEENGSYALICACNGRYYGGGFNPVPHAQPDDGIIDYLIVKNVSRMKFLKLVGDYAKGRYAMHPDMITYYAGKEMNIENPHPMSINIDGEIEINNKLFIDIRSKALNFIFPKGSDYLSSRLR